MTEAEKIDGPEHILVESESAFRYASDRRNGARDRVWHTTSPWLLEKLTLLGERVKSLEEGAGEREFHQLGLLAKGLSHRMAAYLDGRFGTLAYGIRIGDVLSFGMWRCLFPLLYKLFLLNRWLRHVQASRSSGFIVGSGVFENRGLELSRFATYYMIIAREMVLPGNVAILECPAQETADLVERIRNVGTSGKERALSLVNYNLELLCFKLWKYLLKERSMQLPFRRRAISIAYLDDCELTDEAFFHLLLQGCHLWRLKSQGRPPDQKGFYGSLEIEEAELRDGFLDCSREFPEVDRLFESGLGSVATVYAGILSNALQSITWSLATLESVRESLLEEMGRDGNRCLGVLSNGFFSPFQQMMYDLFSRTGVFVFSSEHGVTAGLSTMTEYTLDENPMGKSQVALCYNEASRIHHERNWNSGLKCVVTGMPKVNRRIRWPKLQRFMARRLLGIPLGDRLLVYVANLYFNNYIYSPGSCSDTYYHHVKRNMVFEVLGRLNDRCLVKLYPTHRYVDPDPFAELMELPSNVKVVQFFEYRYLRSVGDVIICDSPQSTLGWVWSARVPLVFLDLPSNPLLPDVAEAFDKAIFRIDCSKARWEDEIRTLLTLPHKELVRLWQEKEPVRRKVEEHYIFGPTANAGQRAAKIVVKEMLKWGMDKKAGN